MYGAAAWYIPIPFPFRVSSNMLTNLVQCRYGCTQQDYSICFMQGCKHTWCEHCIPPRSKGETVPTAGRQTHSGQGANPVTYPSSQRTRSDWEPAAEGDDREIEKNGGMD